MWLLHLLRWLYSNVWGNLVASALWATPALWHLHAKLNRHHRELTQGNAKVELPITESEHP